MLEDRDNVEPWGQDRMTLSIRYGDTDAEAAIR
jgi:hypothetical protein